MKRKTSRFANPTGTPKYSSVLEMLHDYPRVAAEHVRMMSPAYHYDPAYDPVLTLNDGNFSFHSGIYENFGGKKYALFAVVRNRKMLVDAVNLLKSMGYSVRVKPYGADSYGPKKAVYGRSASRNPSTTVRRPQQGETLVCTKTMSGHDLIPGIAKGDRAIYLGKSQIRMLNGAAAGWVFTLEIGAPFNIVSKSAGNPVGGRSRPNLKGMYVDVYRSPGGDSTLGGATSTKNKVLLVSGENTDIEEGIHVDEIFRAMPGDVVLELRRMKSTNTMHAVPVVHTERWYMFGGNFVYTSDSRFPSKYPIPVHDRYEG
ncbi:MAG: hypothetical protein WC455_27440 [Dehalococcoidia bacterium]|jgi:hypothetical protein